MSQTKADVHPLYASLPIKDTDLPIYIALPKAKERERYTSLSRATLDRLTRPQRANNFNPPVESRVYHGGYSAGRGRRLIVLKSLLEVQSSERL